MHFFKFKLNSNNKVASIEIYTTYKLEKKKIIKISNLKKQIKINFKHKKLNYRKWVINLVVLFQSYIFKNWNIIDFKHKKLNYDEKKSKK